MPLALAVALVAGIFTGKYFFGAGGEGKSRGKLDEIISLIDKNYVDDINTDSLLEASLPKLMAGLDPHSVYIPAADLQEVNEELEGSFSGVGISFNLIGDTINVVEIISGGPAEKVGMLPGDRIVTIDDSIVAGKGWSDVKVRSTLRGPKDTKVNLGIRRSSSPDLLNFTVTRGDIPVTSIDAAYPIAPGIGYIKVNKFGASTYSEFLTSLMELIEDDASDAFIIDLRSNGGGYMEVAEMMVNEFLGQGMPIVSMKGKNTPDRGPTRADGRGTFKEADVVVLLDEFSASSSEIFAGAIQDNDRGLIVGRRSFGKGLVQNQLPLKDGSALRLTIARYYTPSGRCIQKTYAPGVDYDRDLLTRFERGEQYSRDSIKLNTENIFHTLSGRTVYGGGGIMPDIFVASDTADISSDYLRALNAGLLQKFAFKYVDAHRAELEKAEDVSQLLDMLPSEWTLAAEFQTFARANGVAITKAYNVNKYRQRLVNSLKALIARDVFGVEGYYVVDNLTDPTVQAAIRAISDGKASAPVTETILE